MFNETHEALKYDNRLRSRRDWISPDELAQELAALSYEDRNRLADKCAVSNEAEWRQWIPEPFRPDDLRLTPLELLGRYPMRDVAELGHERGSALEEFLQLGPEAFAKASKKVRSTPSKKGTVHAKSPTG